MKLSFAFIAFLLFASCSNNSSPGANNNNSSPATTVNSIDYCPLSNGRPWTGHIRGTIAYSDQYGNVYQRDQIDNDYVGSLGNDQTRFGNNVFPVYASDANGVENNNGDPVAYTGFVIAMNKFKSDIATIFPQNISVGQSWTPAPLTIRINQVTFVQHLTQFTTQGGTSYSDIIKLNVIYLDSTFDTTYGTYSQDIKYSANVELYLAKGIGLIEADVNNYNNLNLYNDHGSVNGYGKSATGSLWLKN